MATVPQPPKLFDIPFPTTFIGGQPRPIFAPLPVAVPKPSTQKVFFAEQQPAATPVVASTSLGGALREVVAEAFYLATALKPSLRPPFLTPSPFAITYALPTTHGGAVNPTFYGYPEYVGLGEALTQLDPKYGGEFGRGRNLKLQELRDQFQRKVRDDVAALTNFGLLNQLKLNRESYRGSVEEFITLQFLASEVKRRELSGRVQKLETVFGPQVTVEGLLISVPTSHPILGRLDSQLQLGPGVSLASPLGGRPGPGGDGSSGVLTSSAGGAVVPSAIQPVTAAALANLAAATGLRKELVHERADP